LQDKAIALSIVCGSIAYEQQFPVNKQQCYVALDLVFFLERFPPKLTTVISIVAYSFYPSRQPLLPSGKRPAIF
jgi:hypothetical protein